MDKKLPIRIRKANQEDVNFIFNSWLKSFRGSRFAQDMSNTIYFNEHHKVLERLAKTSEIIIACADKDPEQIFGYICVEKIEGVFVLHYIYVKHTYRGMGIAKLLLSAFEREPDTTGCYTHHTRIAEKLAGKYDLVYHPYLLSYSERSEDVELSGPAEK